ncbi:MAG: hypothetical protein K6F99_07360 [Lachnospiraceae bacterium]|nr:hypothetical protein [Lachnospiraceae bacterium]
MKEDRSRAIIMEAFYGRLIEDYIENYDESVIYRYLYEGMRCSAEKNADKSPEKAKKADYLFREYQNLGKAPEKDKLKEFTVGLITFLCNNQVVYNYHDKRLVQEEDLKDIIFAIKPFFTKDQREELEPDKNGRLKGKAKLNKLLKSALETLERAEFDIGAVNNLMTLVTNRMICKAFDDFLYNAGFALVDRDKVDSLDHPLYEVFGDDKGRKDKKTDKTLELIYRYYLKYWEIPVSGQSVRSEGFREMCDGLLIYLTDKYNKRELENTGIEIPLSTDIYTGCSLHLLGQHYIAKGKVPFVFAIMVHNADEGSFTYEYYDYDGSCRFYTDIDKAIDDYILAIAEAKDTIINNNRNAMLNMKDGLDAIPAVMMRYFVEDMDSEADIMQDTRNHVNTLYENEKGDGEYIPHI